MDKCLEAKRKGTTNPLTLEVLQTRERYGCDEGNCQYFIKRKGRFCTRRAAPLQELCTDHSEESLVKALERDRLARTKHDVKMRELIGTLSPQKIREDCLSVIDDIIAKLVVDAPGPETSLAEKTPARKRTRDRNKRVSAPKRMANPSSIHLTPNIEDLHTHWSEIYQDISRPLHIDVGCAKGKCIENLSLR